MKIKQSIIITLAAAMLGLAVMACSVGNVASPDKTKFIIDNKSQVEICYVYISPADSAEWGDDQLAGDATIPPGTTYEFPNFDNGTYDVTALNCDGNEIDHADAVEFKGDDVTWTFRDN